MVPSFACFHPVYAVGTEKLRETGRTEKVESFFTFSAPEGLTEWQGVWYPNHCRQAAGVVEW